jgi:hypothetical protein
MSKTTALTFTAAFVLFAACILIGDYASRSAARQGYAEDGAPRYAMYDGYDWGLESLETPSGFMGLLAASVSVAGVIMWVREDEQPHATRASILKLDERRTRPRLNAPVHRNNMAGAQASSGESGAQPHEAESLTPLERVIRGY